jgi:hypothetical protein
MTNKNEIEIFGFDDDEIEILDDDLYAYMPVLERMEEPSTSSFRSNFVR